MRWLMIALLASVAGLLLAVAGVARHIWLRRSRLQSNPSAGPGAAEPRGEAAKKPGEAALARPEETERDLEI